MCSVSQLWRCCRLGIAYHGAQTRYWGKSRGLTDFLQQKNCMVWSKKPKVLGEVCKTSFILARSQYQRPFHCAASHIRQLMKQTVAVMFPFHPPFQLKQLLHTNTSSRAAGTRGRTTHLMLTCCIAIELNGRSLMVSLKAEDVCLNLGNTFCGVTIWMRHGGHHLTIG